MSISFQWWCTYRNDYCNLKSRLYWEFSVKGLRLRLLFWNLWTHWNELREWHYWGGWSSVLHAQSHIFRVCLAFVSSYLVKLWQFRLISQFGGKKMKLKLSSSKVSTFSTLSTFSILSTFLFFNFVQFKSCYIRKPWLDDKFGTWKHFLPKKPMH